MGGVFPRKGPVRTGIGVQLGKLLWHCPGRGQSVSSIHVLSAVCRNFGFRRFNIYRPKQAAKLV